MQQPVAVEQSRQLRAQLVGARKDTLGALLSSTAQMARMLDAHRALASAHGRLAETFARAGRSLAAARERHAATRWERRTVELEARFSHPPAVVLGMLGVTRAEPPGETSVCPVCASTDTVACSGRRLVCHECGHVSRVLGSGRACARHHWTPTLHDVTRAEHGRSTVEEHCSVCGEVRLTTLS